jgi:hypothetical protein
LLQALSNKKNVAEGENEATFRKQTQIASLESSAQRACTQRLQRSQQTIGYERQQQKTKRNGEDRPCFKGANHRSKMKFPNTITNWTIFPIFVLFLTDLADSATQGPSSLEGARRIETSQISKRFHSRKENIREYSIHNHGIEYRKDISSYWVWSEAGDQDMRDEICKIPVKWDFR